MAADGPVGGYAEALLAVATAEGRAGEVEDELFQVAQLLRSSEDLQRTVGDGHVPVERRLQIVEDLLGGRASVTTANLVSLVVGAGRGSELPAIVDEMIDLAAKGRHRGVARVRSAIDLSDEQKARLAAAIKSATGDDVEIRVIIDPTVLGGVVTEIGDDIIDGSVRRRLNQMRESFR